MRKAFDPTAIVLPPDAERALAGPGLTLSRLFDLQLARDPVIREWIDHVSGHTFDDWSSMSDRVAYHCDATAILDRHFLQHQKLWPSVLDGYDLFVEWCDQGGYRFARTEPTERRGLLDHLAEHNPKARELLLEIHRIAGIVHARYEATITLLRSGALEAFGHVRGSGEPSRISVAVWSTPKTRIDFGENEVHQFIRVEIDESGSRPAPRRESTEAVWSGVVVRRPAKSVEGNAVKAVQPPKSQGGAPEQYPWNAAFDRLVIDLMENGEPETGAELTARMVSCLVAEHFPQPNDEYVKQYLRKTYPRVWEKSKSVRKASATPTPRKGR